MLSLICTLYKLIVPYSTGLHKNAANVLCRYCKKLDSKLSIILNYPTFTLHSATGN